MQQQEDCRGGVVLTAEQNVLNFVGLDVMSRTNGVPVRIAFREKRSEDFSTTNIKERQPATTATIVSTEPPASPPAACTAHRRRLSSPSSSHAHSNTTMSMRA